MVKKKLLWLNASVVAAVFVQPAVAADDAWSFELTPYVFGSGLDGSVKVGRLPAAGVEADFSDILDVLDFGLMGALEGRKGAYGFIADAIYFKVSDHVDTPGSAFGRVNAKMTEQVYSMAGTWRPSSAPLDVVGGLRYMRIKADLELTDGALAGRRTADTRTFTDAYLGLRLQAPVADGWTAVAYADVGAGGSDLSYQLAAGVNYAPSDSLSWKFGYRAFSVDYDKDGFVYDMRHAGPYLGLGVRF